jgi:molybdopterin/thiamine biosynthesis adenylyltransferase
MNYLVFENGALRRSIDDLLSSDLETAAIVLAEPVHTPSGHWRLLARTVIVPPSEVYLIRTKIRVQLAPVFIAEVLKKARNSKQSVILVHTHPFDGEVLASEIDKEGERQLFPRIFARVPGVPHGRAIFGRKGYDAMIRPQEEERELPLELIDVGREVRWLPRTAEQYDMDARFDRQIRAFGSEGQARIQSLRVGIVGLGGTGSVVAQQLAHLGVGRFLLIDPDSIESSNLNRVIGSTPQDVGRSKVEIGSRLIKQISPLTDVRAVDGSVYSHKIARELLDTDFFFCCTDSQGSRAVLTQLAYQYRVPCIDLGVSLLAKGGEITRITGRVQMLAPGLPCLICLNLLDSEAVRRDLQSDAERRADPYIVGGLEPQPAVVSINSVVASFAVTMFLAAVTDMPMQSRYQIYRGDSGVVSSIVAAAQPDCVVCSSRGADGRGDSWTLPGRINEA